ncbi:two-component regulator propeller domain-containing protein [Arenimonas caeni]|jgi:diguanylate cyclase (GGDEF)-like protein|uniref:two-component regulator propeller domain-containing protein n=1 Tax=Arenimonas caeni TaxID=2058085 RepID=UPI002A36A474|nr:two-component regulator propeller domain-containing protein [Arenimonas caeni]MDY0022010.1 two-component regulator propeller domain-containing protein [Arenimonas caeni]
MARAERRPGIALAALLLALPALPASALDDKPLESYAREVWSTRDGLPHNQVNSIVQTPEGYLWFATWEGVVRYNGQEFRSFGRNNVEGLRDSGVRAVSVSPRGALVVATSRGGVSVMRDGAWSTYTRDEGLAQDETFAAIEDRAGRLWVATESRGVTRMEGDRALSFTASQGLPSEVAYALAEDGSGAVWVGTGQGIARIEGERVQAFGTDAGLPASAVSSLAVAADGRLYAGTEDGLYVGQGGRFAPAHAELAGVAVASLELDENGTLWIGTVDRGLMRLGVRGLERFGVSDGLPNSRVASLFSDREGNLWVGTNAGLMRFTDTPFITIDSHQGLSDDYVRALLEAGPGEVLVGTSRGLDRWHDERIEPLEGLQGDSVLSLARDRAGNLWIGTYSTGLVRWRDGSVRERLLAGSGLPSNQVRAVLEGRDGRLWIGTSRGLMRRGGEGGDRVLLERDGLPRDFVLSLFEASDGSVWVGTSNGAARIRGEEITRLDISGMDEAQDVFGMHEDPDGTLWLATDRGVLRYRGNRLDLVGGRQGLPVDAVFQVVVDTYGNFWLTSNAGVIHVRREDMEASADGRAARLEYQQFAEADGMGSAQCNGGAGPAALRIGDGSIWVATARGVAVVQPDELPKYQLAPPPVVIEGLRVDDRNTSADGQLVLPPGTRKLELDYVSLSYRTPEQIRYRYRLDGFDNAWVERNQLRNAQYTNLPPGKYRFQVSAAQRGSGWSPETASVSFEIEPMLWQRPWFLPAAGALLALGLYGLYRVRVGRLEARENQLSRLVEERTRALSEKNSELEQKNETIRKQSEVFEQLSRTDGLTGLANRRSMEESLAAAWRRAVTGGTELSFGLLDIDHFKRINDGYSHDVGDEVLRRVAGVLRSQPTRVQVARWGGEEFALLFPGTGLAQAQELAEGLRRAIETIESDDVAPGLRITASIGLAGRGGLPNYEKMVSQADQRLYEAKHAGRNRVVG